MQGKIANILEYILYPAKPQTKIYAIFRLQTIQHFAFDMLIEISIPFNLADKVLFWMIVKQNSLPFSKIMNIMIRDGRTHA